MNSLRHIALAVLCLCAPAVAGAQEADTRAEQARKEREAKAQKIEPYRRTGLENFLHKMEDDLVLERIFNPDKGLFVRFGNIAEGAGLGGGPSYRLGNPDANLTIGAVASIKRYWLVDAALAFPNLAHGHAFANVYARRRDFPQEDYFGVGPDSLVEDRTNYALRETLLSGTAGVRPVDWFEAGGRIEWFDPRIGRGTDKKFPTTQVLFTEGTAPGLVQQPDFMRYEGFVRVDYRDFPLAPRRGGHYLVSFSKYADRDFDRYSFRRFEIDAQQYVPFLHRHRILALRTLVSLSDPDTGNEIPFYLQRTLGGAYTLRGFRAFRFRDRHALLMQAEYRFLVNNFVTGALFYDAGKVAHRAEDLDFSDLEKDYGFGVRLGSNAGVAIRLDIAFGSGEGARYLLRFNNVF